MAYGGKYSYWSLISYHQQQIYTSIGGTTKLRDLKVFLMDRAGSMYTWLFTDNFYVFLLVFYTNVEWQKLLLTDKSREPESQDFGSYNCTEVK